MCLLQLPLWLKVKLQYGQANGLSPVWVRMWASISLILLWILGQYGQPNVTGPSLIGSFCNIKQKFQQNALIKLISWKFYNLKLSKKTIYYMVWYSQYSIFQRKSKFIVCWYRKLQILIIYSIYFFQDKIWELFIESLL